MVEPLRMISPSVTVTDLSLVYPAHDGARAHLAIEGLDFTVAQSGVLAVLGESGSGKSSLVKFLSGNAALNRVKATRVMLRHGEASVLGVPLKKISRRKAQRLTAHIGYLSQDAGATLPPDLSISEVLLEPISSRSSRFDRREVGEQIMQMIEMVGLPAQILQSYPSELSKGQRQRIAVVRALVLEPAIVIADEPTLGVDANNRPRIIELLRWYREKHGATMVLVTHDIRLLETLAQDILILQQGTAVGYGKISDIFRSAEHEYVKQLAQALRATAYDEIADA